MFYNSRTFIKRNGEVSSLISAQWENKGSDGPYFVLTKASHYGNISAKISSACSAVKLFIIDKVVCGPDLVRGPQFGDYWFDQSLSNFGSRNHLGSRNVIWGREISWLHKSDMKIFVNFQRKLKVSLQ